MFAKLKSVIGLIVMVAGFYSAYSQDMHTEIVWYRSFFTEKKGKSSDPFPTANKQLQNAKESHNGAAELKALQTLGLLHLTRSHDYEQSLDYLIQALKAGDSLHLNQQQIFTSLAIAQVFEEVGSYYKSLDFLEQALAMDKAVNDAEIRVLIFNKLGSIHTSLENIDEAFLSYEKVIEYQDEIRQPTAEAEALFSIGHLHQLQHSNDKALEFQKKALVLWRKAGDRKNEAVTLSSIGTIYGAMKNSTKELANHDAALEIRTSLNDKRGTAESANLIGAFYLRSKNYKKAFTALEVALRAGQESQDQAQLSKTYDYLSQCYQLTNNFKKALEYKDLLLKLNDFTVHEKDEQRLLEMQNSYSIGKKQLTIEKLEADRIQREKLLSDEQKLRSGLQVVMVLSGIILLLVLYLYINKRRSNALLTEAHKKLNHQNTELKDLNATKDKFFSILGHDLKGPLNSLSSFSNLLSNHLESLRQDEIKMLSKDLDKQLKNLFALLENLLEWARSQTGAIEFTPEPFDIALVMEQNRALLQGQAQNKKISLLVSDQTSVFVNAHKQSVNTVVRNLISNSIKFTPSGGAIMLDTKKTDAMITVSISDTGVGMSPAVIQKLFRIDTKHSTKGTAEEKGTGLGLILCKDFIEKNGGRIWVESEEGKGSVFYFTLPAA